MTLTEKIADDLKKALKTGNKDTLAVLRMIKSSMKNREIEKKAELTDDDVQTLLLSYAKRSKESIEQFSRAGRPDLAEKEEKELSVVRSYLPAQLGEEEVRKIINDVIRDEGAAGAKDLGKVMKASIARMKGQAESKMISAIVKEMLEA